MAYSESRCPCQCWLDSRVVNPLLSGGNVFCFFFLISLLVRLASFYSFIDEKVKGLELSEEVSGIWYKKHISRIIEWAHTKKIYTTKRICFHDSRGESCPDDCEVDISGKFWVDSTKGFIFMCKKLHLHNNILNLFSFPCPLIAVW